MSQTPPTRKVVRRVVRKPVVLPGDRPAVEGTATTTAVPPAPTREAAPEPAPAPQGPSRLQRARTTTSSLRRAGSTARRVARSAAGRVRGWRLPAWPDVVWTAVVGGVLGVLATAAGAGARELFSAVRGVSTGGGTWGSLALVLIGLGAIVLGEVALRALHVPQPRATSLTGVLLVLMAVLAFFVDAAATAWAWLLLPALGAAAYALATWLLGLGRTEEPV
jgi:hypothetical protein